MLIVTQFIRRLGSTLFGWNRKVLEGEQKARMKRWMAAGLCQESLDFILLGSCKDKVNARLLDDDTINDVTRQTGLSIILSPARSSLVCSPSCACTFFPSEPTPNKASFSSHHKMALVRSPTTSTLLHPMAILSPHLIGLPYSLNKLFVEYLLCARSQFSG